MAYMLLRFILILVSIFGFSACSTSTDVQPSLFVVNGGDSTVSVIDPQKLSIRRTISLPQNSYPHHAYLNPQADQLAISLPGMDFSGGHGGGGGGGHGMPGRIALLNTQTGEIQMVLDTPAMNHNAAFSPDGSELWTATMKAEGMVLVYDTQAFKLLKEIPVGSQPAEVTFSADGKKVFVANGKSNTVTVIDYASKKVLATLRVGENPVGAWSGSDNRMYVDNEHSKTVTVINADTLKTEGTISLGFTPGMVAYHATSNTIWVSDSDQGRVAVFTATGQLLKSLPSGAGTHGIVFSRDGQLAYVTNQMANTVSVFDVPTYSQIKDIPVGEKPNGLALWKY